MRQLLQTSGPARITSIARAGTAVALGLLCAAIVALAVVGPSHGPRKAVKRVTAATTADPSADPKPNPGPPATVTYVNTTIPIAFGGMERSYLLSRPLTRYGPGKLPVIVVLHGRDATPAQEQQRTNFTSVVAPSILVYPSGYQGSWNAGQCCGAAQAANLDDVGFITAVLAHVKATESDASPGMAFLAGYSNGGKLALRVACERPGDFAGFAVYGATDSFLCSNRPAAAVLVMAGAADNEVPADSTPPNPEPTGYGYPSFTAEINSYVVADGCSAVPPAVSTVGMVTLSTWVQCSAGERVGDAIFIGQGHGWPTGSATSPSGEGIAWAWFSSLGA